MTTIALPIEFSTRPTTEGDQQAIADLLIAHECHFYGNSHMSALVVIGDVNAAWRTDGVDQERDSLLVLAPDRQIVGYAMIYRAPDEPQTIIASPVIHPNFHAPRPWRLPERLGAATRYSRSPPHCPRKGASCSSPGSKISTGWLTTCSPAGASRLSATSGIWRSTWATRSHPGMAGGDRCSPLRSAARTSEQLMRPALKPSLPMQTSTITSPLRNGAAGILDWKALIHRSPSWQPITIRSSA